MSQLQRSAKRRSGLNLKQWRKTQNLTQKELQAMLRLKSRQAIIYWESGRNKIPGPIRELLRFLGCNELHPDNAADLIEPAEEARLLRLVNADIAQRRSANAKRRKKC